MEKSYNSGLVLLSVAVAVTGAYVAVEIAQRVREATGRRRNLWLAGGSLAMGLGIWSMHFVAMLALRIAEPVWYDGFITFLSVVAAVLGCAVAFAIFDRSTVKWSVLGSASVFMGFAIAGMHYTGMAAMRMSGGVRYDWLLVAASLAVAIAVSFAALLVTRSLLTSHGPTRSYTIRTAGAALLMGLAVVSMHYTGMAAATFTEGTSGWQPEGVLLLGNRYLGVVVAVVSLALLTLALAGTQFERWSVRASTRMESLLQLSPQVVWSANPSGLITDCNMYWYHYTGLTPAQSLGAAWVVALHPDDVERMTSAWRRAVETVTDLETEFRLRRADGAYHWFLSRGRPVLGVRGEVIRWIGIAIDIEERKIAEREILTREQALATANRAKADFLASMSHELRTPLNAIGGYADLLEMGLRGPLTPAQTEDVARIKRSQQHLLGLINDVLNFAKVDAGRLEYRIGDVLVQETIADTESMIRPQLKQKGLTYSFACEPAAGVVRADREKLQQIVLNLLSNAVKFTDPGGAIAVSCDADRDTVRLCVSDTGIGIPADKIETIFDPFVQVDQRLSQMSQGVGLGLSISRELARAMSGDISAESTPGNGSTFTLTLPRAGKGAPAEVAEKQEQRAAG